MKPGPRSKVAPVDLMTTVCTLGAHERPTPRLLASGYRHIRSLVHRASLPSERSKSEWDNVEKSAWNRDLPESGSEAAMPPLTEHWRCGQCLSAGAERSFAIRSLSPTWDRPPSVSTKGPLTMAFGHAENRFCRGRVLRRSPVGQLFGGRCHQHSGQVVWIVEKGDPY